MKKMTKRVILCLLFGLTMLVSIAQQKRITGTVRDDKGMPVPGATFMVKGTNIAGSADENGNFSVSVNDANAILVFSSVNFASKEVTVGQGNTLDVVLLPAAGDLGEVVVTALGVRRAKKSLGYAVQEVKGGTLAAAKETNLVNALSGKVAGLQVVRSSNGPAGSSKIVLRGMNSLSIRTQPLIVVDGVPMDNFTGATNNDMWNPSFDMGNGLADINAEDIESISVLKGPSAAALYGSRAGNGVILITTKTGRKQPGLGITVNSSLGIESIFLKPELQSEFGQGSNGEYENRSNLSWGPKITGQQVENWDGKMVPMAAYDNLDNYFDNGVVQNHGVTFQEQFRNTSVYTSINYLDDKSMLPGIKLTRTNLMARAVTKFGAKEKWTTDTKIQYSNANAKNRPMGGIRPENGFFTMYQLPRSMDITGFSAGVNELGKMIWYDGSSQVNPYWSNKYNLNQDVRDRYIMNGSLKYDFTNWLNAEIRAGADFYNTNMESKLYGGSPLTSTGRYSMAKQTFLETNYSTLISAKKENLVGRLGGNMSLGGNLMSQENSSLSGNSGELVVPDLFALNNGKDPATVEEGFLEQKINSVYGTLGFNWDGYLFLDATFRNDWSSTLIKENRSYIYPSISTALVLTDMLDKMGANTTNWLSYAKLRASFAEVGNSLQPYELYNTYSIGKDPWGNTTASRGNILFNPYVKAELIKSLELGAEMRFLNGRFGLDASWYKTNATNQLINLPMDPMSGYQSRKINAGDIQNKGYELMADARILTNPRSFNWNLMVNFSHNDNTIKELADGVKTYPLGGFDDLQIVAEVGGKYGEIYGTRYKRVNDEKSPYYGQLLLNQNGLPEKDPVPVRLGTQQAKGLLGITNSFAYKGLSLSFLIDARIGGQIFSGTNAALQRAGTAAVTAENGRENMVVEGVIFDAATNTYSKNTVAVRPEQYWTATAGVSNLGISELNIYDASNTRLRNVQLGYELPKKLLGKTPLQRAKIGVSANNVWMISSHLNGVDPESVFATGTNALGFENASAPTTRTILFNVTLGF